MRNQDQTLCPNCNIQYCDSNPPRLLTMCGHTICERCIKNLIAKKKVNGKLKVNCPFDKKFLQVVNQNVSNFPKNLSLLNLSNKKGCENKSSCIKTQKKIENQKVLQIFNTNTKTKTQEQIKDKEPQICLLHLKPIQLVCMRDYQRICSSCVIFGQHKGHQVKKQNQVLLNINIIKQKLQNLLKQQTKYFQKLSGQQMRVRIQSLIQKKRLNLQHSIKQMYKDLIHQLQQKLKKTVINLNQTIKQIKEKIQLNLKQKIQTQNQYKNWQNDLKQKINILKDNNSNKNLDQYQKQKQKLKIVFKSQNFIQKSQQNIQLFKQLYDGFVDQVQRTLNNLTLSFDIQQIIKFIDQNYKIQDASNSFLDICNSKIALMKARNQQSLLDEQQTNPLASSTVHENQLSERSNEFLNKSFSTTGLKLQQKQNKLNTTTSIINLNKQPRYQRTPNKRNSLFSTKKLSLGTKMLNISHTLKSKQIPQKIEEKIQFIIKNKSEVLDLTNGELGNQKIMTILNLTKEIPLNIIKLVKDKLNDNFIMASINYFDNIIMLNLSKNQLTQKSLQMLLNARINGKIKNLKSLMIGQNKIIQRNNKQILEQLRKLGINVCI